MVLGRQMHCGKVDVGCQLLLTKSGVQISRGSCIIDNAPRSFHDGEERPFSVFRRRFEAIARVRIWKHRSAIDLITTAMKNHILPNEDDAVSRTPPVSKT